MHTLLCDNNFSVLLLAYLEAHTCKHLALVFVLRKDVGYLPLFVDRPTAASKDGRQFEQHILSTRPTFINIEFEFTSTITLLVLTMQCILDYDIPR